MQADVPNRGFVVLSCKTYYRPWLLYCQPATGQECKRLAHTFKAKMYALSSGTLQLQCIKLHNFKRGRF